MTSPSTAVATPAAPVRPAARPDESAPALDPRRWQALVLLLIGPFLSLYDQFCVNLAAPSINQSFGLTPFQFQAVVGGYGLVYGLGLITGGRLGDLFGRRRMYRVGIALFALTSLACAVARSPGALIAARLAQGGAAAILQPQVLALIRVQFPLAERTKALSWYGISISLGMVAGQVLGGALPAWDVFGMGWRPVFLFAAPLCALAYVAIARTMPADRPDRTGQGVDGAGMALSALGFALLLFPLAAIREWDFWPGGLITFTGGALLIAYFVRHQAARVSGERPALLPVKLFRIPAFVLGVSLNFLLYMASIPFAVLLGLYLQTEAGLSSATAGLVFTPAAVAIAVGSRIGPSLRARFGQGVLVGATALTAVGLAGALAAVELGSADNAALPLMAAFAVYGIGNGMIVPLLTGIVLGHVPPQDAGAGSGVLSTAQQLAAASGIAVVGLFLYPSAPTAPLHYTTAMWCEVVLAALGVLCSALLVAAVRRPGPTA